MATQNVIPFGQKTSNCQLSAFEDTLTQVFSICDEPWWVAKNASKALGIAWQGEKTLDKVRPEWRGVLKVPTSTCGQQSERGIQDQEITLVSEAAAYMLAFQSSKPEVARFVDWVVSEVLPAIRKTGKYDVTSAKPSDFVWSLEEVRNRRGVVDMYRILYGDAVEQWVAPQLGFPTLAL